MASVIAYDAFHDRLTGAWTETPLAFENEDFTPPVDDGAPTAFVFVEIYGDTYNQESIGAPQENMYLETGVAFLHVMTPNGTGSRDARVLANSLLNLFREQETGGVFIEEMSIGAGEPGREFPNYWALAATLHWYRRDITNLTI